MKSIDLGFEPDNYPMATEAESDTEEGDEKEEPSKAYPQVTLNGAAAEKLMGMGLRPDDEVTLTVKCRAVRCSESADHTTQWGSEHEGECQLDLDLQSLDDIQITKKEEDTEVSSDEAVDSYLKGKKK